MTTERFGGGTVGEQLGLVDLFSGCGGLSAGFLATGRFQHLYAADNDTWANSTYRTNLGIKPDAPDLGKLAGKRSARLRWAESIRRDDVSRVVLAGGPPCQGFSSHVKVQGDRHDRNVLVGAFALLAEALEPDEIVVENVPDLFAERNWAVFLRLRRRLERAGYEVRARIVNFAELGVPQERFRALILASRTRSPSFPSPVKTAPTDYSTVKDWIGHLPPIGNGEVDPEDPMHEASRHRAATLRIIEQVPIDGGSRPVGVGPDCLQRARKNFGGYTDVYGRLAWSQPAPTITARCRTPSCGRFVHPEQHRGLTAREAGLLQTFPESWHFDGPFDDRFKQIGNAVPPLAARRIGEHIAGGARTSALEEVGVVEIEDRPIGKSFSVLIPGIRRRGGVL